ncbi:MAG: hypothetical protein ACRC3Z_07295 [Phocaeicola sp.]
MTDFNKAYSKLSKELVPYYRKYTHDKPMVMSYKTYNRTERLGKILNKAITYLAMNYLDWLDYIALSKRDLEILRISSNYPFRVGSYRTDFLIMPDSQLKIIEMTTRFPLNGYIISGFPFQIGMEMATELKLSGIKDTYSPFLAYLSRDFAPTGKVTVVKGNDRMGDFKTYSSLFVDCFDFNVIELSELDAKKELLKNATVIEELNLDEIRALPNDLIDELCKNGVFNDFRNLFLIHDKRFFLLLTVPEFLDKCLTKKEQSLLAEFTIPSYLYSMHSDVFESAFSDKDRWIVKPYNLGKSEGVVAGCTVTEEEWKQLFSSESIKESILQPMINQKKFQGTIGSEIRTDYVAGTLLFFDNHYYGPGLYRASSFVVTNQRDDRKIAPVVANLIEPTFSVNLL